VVSETAGASNITDLFRFLTPIVRLKPQVPIDQPAPSKQESLAQRGFLFLRAWPSVKK
jgi:hypothetical protein